MKENALTTKSQVISGGAIPKQATALTCMGSLQVSTS